MAPTWKDVVRQRGTLVAQSLRPWQQIAVVLRQTMPTEDTGHQWGVSTMDRALPRRVQEKQKNMQHIALNVTPWGHNGNVFYSDWLICFICSRSTMQRQNSFIKIAQS